MTRTFSIDPERELVPERAKIVTAPVETQRTACPVCAFVVLTKSTTASREALDEHFVFAHTGRPRLVRE